MPVTHRNRLRCTVSAVASAGLGAFTVGPASSGYVGFVAGDDGKTFDVVITEGTAWEVRRDCTYTHSGTTLSRGTLEESSTGSAVTFTAAAVIFVALSAAKGNLLEQQLDRAFTLVVGNGTSQSLTSGANTKIAAALASVSNNPYTWWSTTNKRFLPTRQGNYLVNAALQLTAGSSTLQVSVYKNGAAAGGVAGPYGLSSAFQVATASGIVLCNGTTDYLELFAYTDGAGVTVGSAGNCFVNFTFLGP